MRGGKVRSMYGFTCSDCGREFTGSHTWKPYWGDNGKKRYACSQCCLIFLGTDYKRQAKSRLYALCVEKKEAYVEQVLMLRVPGLLNDIHLAEVPKECTPSAPVEIQPPWPHGNDDPFFALNALGAVGSTTS